MTWKRLLRKIVTVIKRGKSVPFLQLETGVEREENRGNATMGEETQGKSENGTF